MVGGCFDLLHPGHLIFLEQARKAGDILMVLLESDDKVKFLKGDNRPVYTQTARAKVLSAVRFIDYVVKLPVMKSDIEYDQLVVKIKPDIIAISSKDKKNIHHRRAAKLSGGKLKLVTESIGDYSSTKLLNLS